MTGASSWYRQAPVLMYHRLTGRTGEHPFSLAVTRFRGQLAMLRRLGYRSLSPVTLADAVRRGQPLPPHSLVITFDDGYADTLTVALPLLKEFGFTATCYLVAGAVGGRSDWTDPAPLMDWEGARAWLAAGMEIGSHSVSHPDLTRLDDAQVREEVAGSRRRIEDRLGVAAASFAYPFNRVDPRVMDAVAAAGYAAACANAEIYRSPYALSRVDPACSWEWFAVQLLRAYPALRHAYRAAIPRRTPRDACATPALGARAGPR
jgi:peptidoglycan/xylan/chitin deacetylase (PgdA/CDA1 family)